MWRAWRVGLDCGAQKKMTFNEFCVCTRAVGYFGNIRELFADLDVEGTGYIGLAEMDYPLWSVIKEFRDACVKKWGSLMEAWLLGLDYNSTGRVEERDFLKVYAELGCKGRFLLFVFSFCACVFGVSQVIPSAMMNASTRFADGTRRRGPCVARSTQL